MDVLRGFSREVEQSIEDLVEDKIETIKLQMQKAILITYCKDILS